MNIFYLDEDPQICAQAHCDKHVVKMVLEYAQLLSTCHRVMNPENAHVDLYKATHVNHPCNKWLRESALHYNWLKMMWRYLTVEYNLRYKKTHKSSWLGVHLALPPESLVCGDWDDPPQCMPDKYKQQDDVVKAYRDYYIGEKAYFAKWKNGNVPEWFKNG